jgi:hypothetical protein
MSGKARGKNPIPLPDNATIKGHPLFKVLVFIHKKKGKTIRDAGEAIKKKIVETINTDTGKKTAEIFLSPEDSKQLEEYLKSADFDTDADEVFQKFDSFLTTKSETRTKTPFTQFFRISIDKISDATVSEQVEVPIGKGKAQLEGRQVEEKAPAPAPAPTAKKQFLKTLADIEGDKRPLIQALLKAQSTRKKPLKEVEGLVRLKEEAPRKKPLKEVKGLVRLKEEEPEGQIVPQSKKIVRRNAVIKSVQKVSKAFIKKMNGDARTKGQSRATSREIQRHLETLEMLNIDVLVLYAVNVEILHRLNINMENAPAEVLEKLLDVEMSSNSLSENLGGKFGEEFQRIAKETVEFLKAETNEMLKAGGFDVDDDDDDDDGDGDGDDEALDIEAIPEKKFPLAGGDLRIKESVFSISGTEGSEMAKVIDSIEQMTNNDPHDWRFLDDYSNITQFPVYDNIDNDNLSWDNSNTLLNKMHGIDYDRIKNWTRAKKGQKNIDPHSILDKI